MNALRIRTQAFNFARKHTLRLPQIAFATHEARLYSSNPLPVNTSHTPDTYQKDDEVVPPTSSKTHVISEDHSQAPRTSRPFEAPSGSYATVDSSKPYDPPAKDPEEDHSKLAYGGTERGGAAKDVNNGHDGPQGEAGKKGRA